MQQNNWFYRLPPAGAPSLLQKRGRVLITGLPLRQGNKTKEHKDKQCRGAPMCAHKHTQAKNYRADTPVCPYGKAIRQKNRKTNNVGVHRCVRQKNTQAKRSDGGDEDKRTKKGRHFGPTTKKVLLHDENDETPRKNDLRALPLCNPPAL